MKIPAQQFRLHLILPISIKILGLGMYPLVILADI